MTQTQLRLPDPNVKVFRKDIYFERTGYRPHRGQVVLHADNTRHRAVSNGRRWGKTLAGAKEAEVETYIKNFLGQPKMGWIIGPNYSDCEKEFRVVYNSLKALGVDQVSDKFLNNVESGSMRIHTNWGFDLQCRSAAHPDSLVGEGLDFVLIVEAGKHHRRTFTEYVRPALSDKRGWSLMTGVPELASETSLLYWAYERGQDKSKLQWNSYQMPSWTNNIVFPGGRNDPEILEAEDDLTTDEFNRQYGGQFVERIGRVMSHWDDSANLVEGLEYNPLWPLYAAVDYGYTNDWVWLWIQVDPFNNVYILGEERWKVKDTDEICDEIIVNRNSNYDLWSLLDKVNVIYCPPAEPSQTSILRRKLGRPIATNTGGEINERNKLTNSLLKQRPMHLPDGHPDKRAQLVMCKETTHQLAWEMRTGYRWPEHKSDIKNAPENPMDKDDHGPEALGRFVVGHMSGKMEDRRSARQSRVRARRR
jgi:hypothetical protein